MGRAPTPRDDDLGLPVFPGGLPFLGHSLQRIVRFDRYRDRAKSMDADLVWLRDLPGRWVVDCLDPAGIEILQQPSCSIGPYLDIAGAVLGHSVLTSDGASHRRQRRAMARPFTPRGLELSGTCEAMGRTIEARVTQMIAAPFVALDQTRDLALEIIFQILGIEVDDHRPWRVHYGRLLLAMLPIPLSLPGSPRWIADRSRAWIRAEVRRRIAEARRRPEAMGLLAAMVRSWDASSDGSSEAYLIDNIVLLALAGHETSATVMAWMLAHLAADPDLWTAAAVEAQAADLPTTPDDLAEFPIMTAIFRECLRLHPPLPLVSRQLTEPVAFRGRTLPAGLHVAFPIGLWQRDPDRYPDPDTFSPQRWLTADAGATHIEKISFSAGPHFCMGYHIARLEAVQLGVALVQRIAGAGQGLDLVAGFPEPVYLGTSRPRRAATRMRIVAGA